MSASRPLAPDAPPPLGTTSVAALTGRLMLAALAVAGVYLGIQSGFGLLWFVPYAAVGTLLVVRRRGASLGWLLLGIGWALVLAAAPIAATPQQISAGTAPMPEVLLAVVGGGPAGAAGFLLYFAVMVVFPSGRLPDGTRGKVLTVVLGVTTILVAARTFAPTVNYSWSGAPSGATAANPLAIAPNSAVWQIVGSDAVFLLLVALMIGGATSLVVRFLGAGGMERQQLRWMVTAITFVVIAVIGGFVLGSLVPAIGESGLQWIGAILAFPTVPIAIGIAVLRYRLYEIDRIISRTVSWAAVSGVLVVAFVTLAVGLQSVLAPVISENTLAVAASTLVVAALFQPLRRRVQRAVDRRFDRSRYDGERLALAFADRLRDEVGLETIERDVLGTVDAAVRPTRAGLWIRTGEG